MTSSNIILKLKFSRHNDIEEHVLLLDALAQANLASMNPPPRRRDPSDLVSTLIHHGAMWNDIKGDNGETIPALQRFDATTGNRRFLCHYRQGFRQDPASGVFAEQFFDAATGKRGSRTSYNEYNEDYKERTQPQGNTPALPDYLVPYILKDAVLVP